MPKQVRSVHAIPRPLIDVHFLHVKILSITSVTFDCLTMKTFFSDVMATEAETRKRQKYSSVDDSVYIVQPIAIETLGTFGISAIEFFDVLGHRMQTMCQDTRARMFLMQCLSVAMQRGNAACILGTIADDDFSTDFFV